MKISRELKVGTMTLLAGFILIWGINYLKGRNIFSSTAFYYAVYENSEGLMESGEVRINGVKVGQVMEINLETAPVQRVVVKFVVEDDYNLPKGTQAVLVNPSILSSMAIDLKYGNAMQYHKSGDTLGAYFAAGPMDEVDGMMDQVNSIMASTDSLLKALVSTFDSTTQASINTSIENAGKMSASLEQKMAKGGEIDRLIANVNDLTVSMKAAMQTVPKTMENVSAITDSLKQAQIKLLVNNLAATTGQVDSLLTKINDGQGTVGSLMSSDSLYNNLNTATEELGILLHDFHSNPKRYVHFSLFGNKEKK